MNYRNRDLEMYVAVDPRVALVNDLRRARRAAQWPTWQMDRSWPNRSAQLPRVERASVSTARGSHLPWSVGAAGFLVLCAAAAGLLAAGVGGGLL